MNCNKPLMTTFLLATSSLMCVATGASKIQEPPLDSPDGVIELVVAPAEKFEGQIFLLNDWDGGDSDNQNVGLEVNRKSRIIEGVTVLSDLPGRKPKKVLVDGLVKDPQVLADASKQGKVAIALGAHSRHALAWLTKLPKESYDYGNIIIVSHSNWNELDGRQGYEANKQDGDPPLADTHGEPLRRGLYKSLAKINDLGVTIWEIPRTDSGPGGWGSTIEKGKDNKDLVKKYDISDVGLVHYLKTGVIQATRQQRNEFVSDEMKKPERLEQVERPTSNQQTDAEKIFQEKNGLIVMEMEATDSELGNWILVKPGTEGSPQGATGAGHLEFKGSKQWGKADSPLTYRFKVHKAGKYRLQFRAHKRLEGEEGDKCNDCFVRMEGDFTAGDDEVPLKVLQTDVKLFGGSADDWGTAQTLDIHLKKFQFDSKRRSLKKPAFYEFKEGEVYALIVSGRSQRFNLDRIVISHESNEIEPGQLAALQESESQHVER